MKILGRRVPFTSEPAQPGSDAVTKGTDVVTNLAPLVPSRSSANGGFFGYIRENFAGAWQRGRIKDELPDLTAFSAVFSCISRISTDIGKLRIKLVELGEDGIWREVSRNSPYAAVLKKPNSYQNRIQFVVAWITSKLMFGNTYVLKIRDARGIVTSMHVLDPRRVLPVVTTSGDVYYQLASDHLAKITSASVVLPASEIMHDRGVTLYHPLVGVSPIHACAVSATQGNRIQANSAAFFENMSRPSGLLTAPGTIDAVTAERLKKSWETNFTGNNIGKLAVLGDGLKYEAMSINPDDAQLIEQLRWTVEDVARAFGVPLYKINSGPIPTNNNVEALEGQYYSGCLQILLESMELVLDEGLNLTSPNSPEYGTEFDLDGLLRMDSATLVETLGKGVNAGLLAPNEGRAKMNLPPVAGGNTPYMQQQNWSLAQLDKRDIVADKPSTAAPPAAPTPAPAPAPAAEDSAAKTVERLLALLEKMSVPQPVTTPEPSEPDTFEEFAAAVVRSLDELEVVSGDH